MSGRWPQIGTTDDTDGRRFVLTTKYTEDTKEIFRQDPVRDRFTEFTENFTIPGEAGLALHFSRVTESTEAVMGVSYSLTKGKNHLCPFSKRASVMAPNDSFRRAITRPTTAKEML